jgi:ribose 5-phosphate isomerase B
MKVVLASDHQGFKLKKKIIEWLTQWGHEFVDFGPHELDPDDDYPDFVSKVGSAVSKDSDSIKGIVLGYSGQGEAIVANKYKGVRAVVFYGGTDEIIDKSREHNNSNVLSIGAGLVDDQTAKAIIKQWLETPFTGKERHVRRIKKIQNIEDEISRGYSNT